MNASLFSVSYAGFWGQAKLGLLEFIARAGKLGFGSVMIAGKRPHLSPIDATDECLESVCSALSAARVRCHVIAGYTNLAVGSASEVPLIEMQIAYVESLARIGSAVDAKIVRIFTAYESDQVDIQLSWQRVVSAVREMCDRVAPLGTTIALQNHHDIGLHTDALLDLLGEIDRSNCKLGFDAWSPALRGENLFESARKAAPHTAITTNADYIQVPRYRYRPELVNYERQSPDWVRAVSFGTGFIDYEAFFKGLREGGFDGIAVYEMCSPIAGGGTIENLDAKAQDYLAWMAPRKFISD